MGLYSARYLPEVFISVRQTMKRSLIVETSTEKSSLVVDSVNHVRQMRNVDLMWDDFMRSIGRLLFVLGVFSNLT